MHSVPSQVFIILLFVPTDVHLGLVQSPSPTIVYYSSSSTSPCLSPFSSLPSLSLSLYCPLCVFYCSLSPFYCYIFNIIFITVLCVFSTVLCVLSAVPFGLSSTLLPFPAIFPRKLFLLHSPSLSPFLFILFPFLPFSFFLSSSTSSASSFFTFFSFA